MVSIFLLVGLFGAILMFVGDMILYYSKNDYVSDGTLNPVIDIMKQESRTRLYIGGMIGPVASFVYCIAFYHLILAMDVQYRTFGWVCFGINCLAIICGGAYHSHWAHLGLQGRYQNETAMKEVEKYINVQKILAFGLQGIGFLLLAIAVILKFTVFPRWLVMFTPGVLFLMLPIIQKFPKGLHMVICGGWTNLISVIYYGVALVVSLQG